MEVTLKKDGWHRKMQEFVFKNPPRYNSLCPYFWFTVFCIIATFIIPVVPIIKLIKIIGWLGAQILYYINKFVCIPLYNSTIFNMSDDDIIKDWIAFRNNDYYYSTHTWTEDYYQDFSFWRNDFTNLSNLSSKQVRRMQQKFTTWKELNPDWEVKIEAIKDKHRENYKKKLEDNKVELELKYKKEVELQGIKWKKDYDKKVSDEAAKVRRQKMFTKIAVYTKWLAYPIVTIIVALIIYCIYLGLHKVYSMIPWLIILHNISNFFIKHGIPILVHAIVIAVLLLVIFLIFKLSIKCTINICDTAFGRGVSKPFIWLWIFIKLLATEIIIPITMFIYNWILIPIGKGIGGVGYGLVWTWKFLMATKEGYCPAIIWKDELNTKTDESKN